MKRIRQTAAKIMVLGGGPNRIGQGIGIPITAAFTQQWLSAKTAMRPLWSTAIRKQSPLTTIPATDSISNLSPRRCAGDYQYRKPEGVIVQYGGQTPLKLARALEANGVKIIGTTPDSIDIAEDRERFQHLLQQLGLRQPPNRTARTEDEAIRMAEEIGYPLVVRPKLRSRRPGHGYRSRKKLS